MRYEDHFVIFLDPQLNGIFVGFLIVYYYNIILIFPLQPLFFGFILGHVFIFFQGLLFGLFVVLKSKGLLIE